jgi:predicted PurR-regulated permease PerM
VGRLTVREKAVAWLLILAAFALLVWLFQPILLPFVAGLAVAYFLDPIADWMERRGIGRGWAATWTLLGFAILSILLLLLLIPVVQSQIVGLAGRLPDIVAALQRWLVAGVERLQGVLSPEEFQQVRDALTAEFGRGMSIFSGLVQGVFARSIAFFEFLSLILVTPVVAFYLLRDWDRIVAILDELLPLEHRATVRQQVGLVDEMLSGFVRGQSSVCIVLALGYGGALAAAGLPFGFTVGLMAGLVSFIPYMGSMFGLVSSVGLALIEFSDPVRIGIVALIFVVGQLIEAYLLTPKLVGERVQLHPVWVIFALFAGGSLMGFLGMLIALPTAAVIGVVVRFLLTQYRQSRLYDHELPGD